MSALQPKEMIRCLCGYGKPVTRKYRPGHDQSLRIAIEKELGGLERLREIAEKLVGHRIVPRSVSRSPCSAQSVSKSR